MHMQTFGNWEEVPLFDSEEAEASFWAENRPDLRKAVLQMRQTLSSANELVGRLNSTLDANS